MNKIMSTPTAAHGALPEAGERDAFESWAGAARFHMSIEPEGFYSSPNTDRAWAAWQARSALSPASPAPAVPLMDHDNHHNALKCPYCNPRKLAFAEPAPAAPLLAEAVERLRSQAGWLRNGTIAQSVMGTTADHLDAIVAHFDATPASVAPSEPVAWMKVGGTDSITDAKKKRLLENSDQGGKAIADTFCVPLYDD